MSRALDMILTGRPVDAKEAFEIGLANRVVPVGEARNAAESLARSISRFPKMCMRADRRSAYEQWDRDLASALSREFTHGLPALRAEALAGAKRFAQGEGRHGRFPS
jgi:enoyl-CoA hydratase